MPSRRTRRQTRKRRKQKKQSGGNLDAFKAKFDTEDKSLIHIGRGGAGIVYLDPDQPTVVFKYGQRSNNCRIWGKEQKIYQELAKHNIDAPLVKLLKMNEFKTYEDDSKCVLELSRVVNPTGATNYTIQVQFGAPNANLKNKSRGHIMGTNLLVSNGIIPEDQLPEYMKQLGQVLARLHYIAKNDGYDLEVFAGKEGDTTILYIGDFDLSEMITEYTPKIIQDRLVWSIDAVPYFPTKDQPELYEPFKTAYIETAEAAGYKEVAEQVMKSCC
jgi:hypothetical protein